MTSWEFKSKPKDEDTRLSTDFQHCLTVFKAMEAEAEPGEVDGNEVPLYEGYLTRLFSELGLSVPYYNKVMSELRHMGCVFQVKRGGGSAKSVWAVVREPTEELWRDSRELPRQSNKPTDILRQRMNDLEGRVTALEAKAHAHKFGEE